MHWAINNRYFSAFFLAEIEEILSPNIFAYNLHKYVFLCPMSKYKEMLNNLLALFLDGEINNEAEAKSFLAKHYPLS